MLQPVIPAIFVFSLNCVYCLWIAASNKQHTFYTYFAIYILILKKINYASKVVLFTATFQWKSAGVEFSGIGVIMSQLTIS